MFPGNAEEHRLSFGGQHCRLGGAEELLRSVLHGVRDKAREVDPILCVVVVRNPDVVWILDLQAEVRREALHGAEFS